MYFSTDPRFKPVRGLPPVQALLCVVCVLILVLNGVSLLRNLDGLNAANSRQAQADQVAAKLQYLNLLVTDAESGLRGYYLSGSDTYLGDTWFSNGAGSAFIDDRFAGRGGGGFVRFQRYDRGWLGLVQRRAHAARQGPHDGSAVYG